ncbi:MAG: 4-hydroxy-3-methylbut-2-en-1-yl diphosphate synthase [bacterium ADurb.Bin243]|nr:MAG: 4-hydroxy-3-methylbut-2-en-1-yl diphosphate synthase [bacterium ADurb.Bin243]HOD40098.1 (E)-4-hydroxy-3-methylbut-2-enyl-diphosphate synthase [Candidatus Wallbacteria bacterium]
MLNRKPSRPVKIGNITIGGGHKIAVQSMCTKNTEDYAAVIDEIKKLTDAGCDIIRIGVLNEAAARVINKIKSAITIPLVADIHFDYRLALIAIEEGVEKLRLNPGNIKNKDHIEMVVSAAKKNKIPIRIGVNSGSAPRELLEKHGGRICAGLLVDSALWEIKLLESFDFRDIVISLKASSPSMTVDAYRKMSQLCDYPLHLGVTEAGVRATGEIRSAIGIGALLYEGIGDTLRVSLTDDPVYEIAAAGKIINALN